MKVTKEKLLLILEAVLLCVVLLLALRPREVLLEQESVAWITENAEQGVHTLSVALPELSVGSYELVITYDAQNVQESCLQLRGGEDYFRSLLYNPVEFVTGGNQVRMSFYLRDKAADLQVYVEGANAQLPTIRGMELVRTSGAARMLFCLLLLVLTPLNLIYAFYRYMGSHTVSKEQVLVWIGVPAIALVASIPLFTDYLLASSEMEQCLNMIGDVAQNGEWSSDAFGVALPILFRKLGFTLNLAYAIPTLLSNVCVALVTYGILYVCFKKRVVAWLGCMFYTLAPWRLASLYLMHDLDVWKILVVALVVLTVCFISNKMLECENKVHKNIFFTALSGGYLFVTLAYMNNMMLWTEGLVRLY